MKNWIPLSELVICLKQKVHVFVTQILREPISKI